jgi:hypothetical protein
MRVGLMTGKWQNWKSKPMSRGEFVAAFLLGLSVLILVEIIVHG